MHKKRNLITKLVALGAFSAIGVSSALAAPTITGVNGTVADGQNITISGSGFGTNAAVGTTNLEFVGGAKGPIESGTAGSSFTRSNWSIMKDWGGDIVYSTNSVPYRSKTLQMTGGGTWPEAPLSYKLPTPVPAGDHIFVSWWQRTTWAGNGQYKILRLSPTNTVVDDPGKQDVYFFHNNSGGVTFGINGGPYAMYPSFSPATPQSTWTRTDVDITTSSTNTGSVKITKYTPGSPLQTDSTSNYTSQTGGVNWNYVIWQNYFGTDGTGTMTAGTVWLNDLFVQHGSQSRVELCDSSSWSTRKSCMVQPPTSWGSSIGVTLNQGAFPTGSTAYLYVVDSSGNASNAQPVTLGSAATSTAPTIPAGLTVTAK